MQLIEGEVIDHILFVHPSVDISTIGQQDLNLKKMKDDINIIIEQPQNLTIGLCSTSLQYWRNLLCRQRADV